MQELARSPTVIKESSMTHHDWNDPEHSPPAKRSKILPEEHESDSRSSFTSEIDIRPNHRMNPMTGKGQKNHLRFTSGQLPVETIFMVSKKINVK